MKINTLELENIKRIKAVKLEPTESGLTIIGGRNGQGKTSVIDAIAWTLGGNKFRPSDPQREGSIVPPHLKITLDNGMIVERSGKNGALKVTDPNGKKSGQQLLDSFISELALDLPRFMNMSNKEKANILLRIIGVEDKLYELESKENKIYNRRTEIGRIADRKKKYADELPLHTGLPKEPISAAELIKQQQDILAQNGENQRKREYVNRIEDKANTICREKMLLKKELDRLQKTLNAKDMELTETLAELETAKKTAMQLQDESTAELEKNIAEIDMLNRKIRENMEREKAEIDAEAYRKEYDDLTSQLEKVRQDKTDLLSNSDLPLPELSVKDGLLTYKGYAWDNMSGSEQLKVAAAIVRKLNPKCGFVLLDKLEQMDIDTLSEFGKWLEKEGLQAIATRVSAGEECSVIIEDGYVKNEPALAPLSWTPGKF
jgi:chromosome segregation ATPase